MSVKKVYDNQPKEFKFSDENLKKVEEILKIIPEKLQDYDDMLLDNPIWKGRLQNVGILTTEECFAYGVTGPSLRASGYSWDLRKSQPYSGIENYEFDVPTLTEGDVFARWRVKVLEIFESSPKQSFKLISRLPRFVPKDRIILFRFFTYCNTYIVCKLT